MVYNPGPEHSPGEHNYREANRLLEGTHQKKQKPPKTPKNNGGFGCIWLLLIVLALIAHSAYQADQQRPSRVNDSIELDQIR